MAITNLVQPTFISLDGVGRPNANGVLEVYVADSSFSTFAAIFSDKNKTSQLPNPLTVSDAGTFELWYEDTVDIRERTSSGAFIRDTLGVPPLEDITTAQGFNLVGNGSFEEDTAGQPDNWTIAPYAGSDIAITTATAADGLQSLEFNTANSGFGGGLATSDLFNVSSGTSVSFSWLFFSTSINTTNTVQVRWYDSGAGVIQTDTLTMPVAGLVPLIWTTFQESALAPSNAVQAELILTGVASGGSDLSQKSYFDGVNVVTVSSNVVTITGVQTITGAKTFDDLTANSPVINTGTYTGAQTGFIGDVVGNSSTATTAVSVTGTDVITQTQMAANSVVLINMTNDSVGSNEIVAQSVNFNREMTPVTINYDFTFSDTVIQPVVAGIYNYGNNMAASGSMNGTISIEVLVDGIWNVLFSAAVANGAATIPVIQVTSNGTDTRLSFVYATGAKSTITLRGSRIYS